MRISIQRGSQSALRFPVYPRRHKHMKADCVDTVAQSCPDSVKLCAVLLCLSSRLYVNWRFMRGIEAQFLALQKGFTELIPQHLLKPFDHKELEVYILRACDFGIKSRCTVLCACTPAAPVSSTFSNVLLLWHQRTAVLTLELHPCLIEAGHPPTIGGSPEMFFGFLKKKKKTYYWYSVLNFILCLSRLNGLWRVCSEKEHRLQRRRLNMKVIFSTTRFTDAGPLNNTLPIGWHLCPMHAEATGVSDHR